jgi:voltage-gated potassium channel
MRSSTRRILSGVAFLAFTVMVSVSGYLLSGWSLLDALYMVVITVFGVGYGETRELSDGLRIFTMFVIMGGCSSLIYIMGGVFQLITEGEIERALGKRRMKKQLDGLVNHVIVCGYGRIGRVLIGALLASGETVVLVDTQEERLELASEERLLKVHGDATRDEVLETAGIMRAKALATVLPSDALNVFITLSAYNLNPKLQIIARGEDHATEQKLLRAGARRVVLPSNISAVRIAQMISRPAVIEFFRDMDMAGLSEELEGIGVSIDQFVVTGSCRVLGLRVGELEASGEGGFMVIAVRRAGGTLVQNPPKDFMFAEEDNVLLLGHKDDLPKLKQRFSLRGKPLIYRGRTVGA